MRTVERIVKVIMYVGIPAVVGAVLLGGDFIRLPDPQTRAIVGAIVGGALGAWYGARQNFA